MGTGGHRLTGRGYSTISGSKWIGQVKVYSPTRLEDSPPEAENPTRGEGKKTSLVWVLSSPLVGEVARLCEPVGGKLKRAYWFQHVQSSRSGGRGSCRALACGSAGASPSQLGAFATLEPVTPDWIGGAGILACPS